MPKAWIWLPLVVVVAAARGAEAPLVANGSLETDADADGWPDRWPRLPEGASWEVEEGNHFLRLTSPAPGKLVLLYHQILIRDGVEALRLTWRQRVSNLRRGKESWYDARILIEFRDERNQKVAGAPGAPNANRDTNGWQERSLSFLVPTGARWLALMPCLFQVERGTFDLDDLRLEPTDPAPVRAAQARAEAARAFANPPPEPPDRAKWPPALHVRGHQLLDAADQPVWLQGVNVVSLEFLVTGDHVLRSILVATDIWRANAIRLPVKEDYWFGRTSGQRDGGQAYRELVEAAITMAANHGAYTILDLHRYRAPEAVHAAFWKDAAARYQDHPTVLFDLFNEPHGTSWEVWRNGGFVPDEQAPAGPDGRRGVVSIGMQGLIAAVRGTGARNVVVCGGLDWSYDLTGLANGFAPDELGGNGLVYAAHIYPWKRDWATKVLAFADRYPLLLGEVGADVKKLDFIPAEAQEDPHTWVPDLLGMIQQYRLHWTGFSFHPGATPRMLEGWDYTPTPFWGAYAKRALAGERFPLTRLR